MKNIILILTILCGGISISAEQYQLFEKKCSGCHALPEPESLTPTQWKAVLKTMQLRMKQAQKPVLTEKELAQISCYLKIQDACIEPK